MSQDKHLYFLRSVWAAYMRGETVLALEIPLKSEYTSYGVSSMGGKLTEIEALGWKLEHWTVAPNDHGHMTAYPVFRAVPDATIVEPGS